jgi:hypothetical protein
MTAITRPATSYLTRLGQRLLRRRERRASTPAHRAVPSTRMNHPSTAVAPRPPTVWHLHGEEITAALKDSWR